MTYNLELKGAGVVARNAALVGDSAPTLQLKLVHHLPGRLRLRSAGLKGDGGAIETARAGLAAITGVASVIANPCTGSLLFEYDPAVLPPERVIDVLEAHGCFVIDPEKSVEPGSFADRLAGAVGDCLLDALAERLALVVIGALA